MQVSSVEWEFVQDLVEPVAWVDAKAFDLLWRRSDDYVGPAGKSSNQAGKYERVGSFIRQHTRLFYPCICLNGDIPSFTDGRHRTAWLRDHGAEAIPFTCSEDDCEILQRLCPTEFRDTFFRL